MTRQQAPLLCCNITQVMREGKDLTLIAFGKLVGYNLKAAEILAEEGIDAEVGHFMSHNLKS